MRINSTKLKKLAQERDIPAQALAAALPQGERRKQSEIAQRKVGNWLAGRDHPRCKPAEIEAMARVLGAQPKDIARFTSVCRFSRTSARKAGLVVDMIRGHTVDEADAMLEFSPRRAAVFVRKTLNAAAEAAQNAEIDRRDLVVAESRIDGGPIIKRFHPKDRGRAHPVFKKTSHIVIGVEASA